jgi:MFS superfamily sulfate permease-like transporter
VGIVVCLRKNRYAPAAVVLVALGVGLMAWRGKLAGLEGVSFTLPHLTLFRASEVWRSLLLAGFAQLPLTATNAVIATSTLISHYRPQRPVSESRLALNQGVMNLVLPFFGGMPMCHGGGWPGSTTSAPAREAPISSRG